MADVRRIVDLYELYGSYKKVARELGICRNTAKKYLHRVNDSKDGSVEEILPKNRKIIQPSRVLTETVLQKIHQHLESNLKHPRKQRLTAKRIWELLVRDGHKIGYTSVKDEVARWKRTNSPREVYILQEPRVGQRAEFDWGEVHLNVGGICLKFYLAVFVLPFSLYRFARLYPRSTRLEVIQAHIEFFHEIRTDEESVGYIRRVAFGERSSFESFDEAIEWLSTCLAGINAGTLYRRPNVPVQGLVQERELMHPLPTLAYENYELKRAAISRYSLVKCEGNFYSVPDTYRPRQITLKLLVDRIDLLDGNDVIASHRRLAGKQQYSLDITHYIKTFHRKPGALPNARVLAQVDELILDLFNRYYLDDPKGFLPILDLMLETSTEALSYALIILKEQDIFPTYDTLRFFLHQTMEQKVEPFAFCAGFEVTQPDLAVFDQMMVG